MAMKETSNYILQAKSKQFYWEGNGQLSIKTFTNGKAYYKTSAGFFAVEEKRHLILNEGPYTLMIDEEEEVESFCIFFKDGLAEEVLASFRDSPEKLLSDPFKDREKTGLFEKTYHTTRSLSDKLQRLQKMSSKPEEAFHFLMEDILSQQLRQFRDVNSLPALRESTREELYRRISIAHEYIRACYQESLTLSEISRAACLSPNHLLRNYSWIYGKTPHQHLSQFRIAEARRLLAQTNLSMTGITFRLGLNNPVSFSKLFKQHTGLSPSQYRKKVILDKNFH
ncbi:AraC family transcriptional regulator [Bacillus sp. P14.5]|uniref:helix-turn-helix domain-containing protein n=1 Tax=Bacillus sp. P14.5 TaxID=1983400 RepID=UPI000DE8BB7A|nr:AraC family transcriptional regulator [Bacillus sp. P14.5]